jgi:hypothetical protein
MIKRDWCQCEPASIDWENAEKIDGLLPCLKCGKATPYMHGHGQALSREEVPEMYDTIARGYAGYGQFVLPDFRGKIKEKP